MPAVASTASAAAHQEALSRTGNVAEMDRPTWNREPCAGDSVLPTNKRKKQPVTGLVVDELDQGASSMPESSPANVANLAESAWNAMREGNLGKAEEMFCSVVARSPQNCSALWGLATLVRKSDPSRSLGFLDRLIDLQPSVAPLYTTRGLLRQEARREVDAVEDFATAVCLQPDNMDALYNLGLCYSELFCPA